MARSKYSNVERRIWRDERVRRLTARQRDLWFYLLTCDAQGVFPGLYVLRLSTAAEDLETIDVAWSVDDVRAALDAIIAEGMAKFDAATSVVWLPKAVEKHVEGVGTKNVKGWRNGWNDVPDCEIARLAFMAALQAIKGEVASDSKKAGCVEMFSARPPKWFAKACDVSVISKDAPSIPLLYPIDAPSMPHRSNENEKENENEQEREQRAGAREHTHSLSDGSVSGQPVDQPSSLLELDPKSLNARAQKMHEHMLGLMHLYPAASPEMIAGTAFSLDSAITMRRELDGQKLMPTLDIALADASEWIRNNKHARSADVLAHIRKKFSYLLGDVVKNLAKDRAANRNAPPSAAADAELLAEDASASETRIAAEAEARAADDAKKREETKAFVSSLNGKSLASFIGSGPRPAFGRAKPPSPQPAPESAPAGQQSDESGQFEQAVGGEF